MSRNSKQSPPRDLWQLLAEIRVKELMYRNLREVLEETLERMVADKPE